MAPQDLTGVFADSFKGSAQGLFHAFIKPFLGIPHLREGIITGLVLLAISLGLFIYIKFLR
jgi:hypothetical protein